MSMLPYPFFRPLPHWVVTDSFPAFYDSESMTAIGQTARLYGAMQGLIDSYNEYIDEVNEIIKEFQDGIIGDWENFKNCLIKIQNDYIETIDTKINMQDDKIADAIGYMKSNIERTTETVINEAIAAGKLRVAVNYDPETENLDIIVSE